jgi:peptidyl-prolyl cis-trans isomerase SurA
VKLKVFSKAGTAIALVGLATLALLPAAAPAQTVAVPTADNPFGLPDEITLFGTESPNTRTATAVVNGYVITGTDIQERVALFSANTDIKFTEEQLLALRVQSLRNLIDETLKIQAAEALDIGAAPEDIERTYAQVAEQNFPGQPQKMAEYLASLRSSDKALKRQIAGELAWENLIRRNIMPFVNVSAEEVNDVLARLEASRGTDEYRLGEIYLSATTENRQTVLQNAEAIVQQLRDGADFPRYAQSYSEATTAAVGGDLGWVRLGQLPPQLGAVVRQLKQGQLEGPIEIPGGFSIVVLINKRQVLMPDAGQALLNLKQITIEFEPGASEAQAQAKIEKFVAALENMRSCADAEAATAPAGASVVSNDQIPAANLPEQLRNIILNLQIGQTTPLFGGVDEGVRVLMLCGRDDPKDTSGPNFASVMDQIEQERVNKRAQRYLRDLRYDAYIEYN